ncbi:uncharacterized protein MYCFIDRAFT_193418 [Pseudocercospora fijiensis CIRAD86]|uniref:Uncharacterized protein n=1 Tax=Pseudocercospora fijiensis (strain CIRAD86) TaxID=383855 RepID=N1QBJ9_PSEFD|nr:uncharacterized protein MYCFIDRAFT_193418 [Pseudocercospora fijiensis CIRAD86]EME89511.1 hypothetical protein MYCFIDRAFT_193418 [Pseudocercospora fijiensis CIRAD86]
MSRVIRAKGCSAKDLDLHSKEALRWPTFQFEPLQNVQVPIAIFRSSNPLGLCLAIKEWLFQSFDSRLYGHPDMLRMESQELDTLQLKTEGVFMPGDSKVRWYYSAVPYKYLLLHLTSKNLLTLTKILEPGTTHHSRLYTFLQTSFSQATHIPEAPDYLNAISITDYAPEIQNPETALDRLLRMESVQSGKEYRDGSEDRYLLDLEEAGEREIAAVLGLHCAEYLLIKRTFFKEFYTEVYRSAETKRGGRVRTDHAHHQWLEEVYGWKSTKSRRLVAAWKELGMLDEERFGPWIKAGGMLGQTMKREMEGED